MRRMVSLLMIFSVVFLLVCINEARTAEDDNPITKEEATKLLEPIPPGWVCNVSAVRHEPVVLCIDRWHMKEWFRGIYRHNKMRNLELLEEGTCVSGHEYPRHAWVRVRECESLPVYNLTGELIEVPVVRADFGDFEAYIFRAQLVNCKLN